MEILISVLIGVGLSAACGFRVFVPLLVMGVAHRAGFLALSEGWDWIGGWPAIIGFSIATAVEIGAFYLPWLDNLLDSLATPAAVVAGIVVTAASVTDMHPFLRWSLAVIAGGGAAGIVQLTTVVVRGATTAVTGGLGNFVVSTLEWVLALAMAILAIIAPVIALILLLCLLFLAYRVVRAWRSAAPPDTSAGISAAKPP
jgi:hypothetical protein